MRNPLRTSRKSGNEPILVVKFFKDGLNKEIARLNSSESSVRLYYGDGLENVSRFSSMKELLSSSEISIFAGFERMIFGVELQDFDVNVCYDSFYFSTLHLIGHNLERDSLKDSIETIKSQIKSIYSVSEIEAPFSFWLNTKQPRNCYRERPAPLHYRIAKAVRDLLEKPEILDERTRDLGY